MTQPWPTTGIFPQGTRDATPAGSMLMLPFFSSYFDISLLLLTSYLLILTVFLLLVSGLAWERFNPCFRGV
jgi:hypothetical protein